jgi:hypothetical protein
MKRAEEEGIMVMEFTQPVPTPEAAMVSAEPGPVGLGLNPAEIVALELPFPAGEKTNQWAVFVRVVLQNNDADAQDARAVLYVAGSGPAAGVPGTLVDEVNIRIPGVQGNPLPACVSLQGVINRTDAIGSTPPHNVIKLLCSGLNCSASRASMIGLDLGSV